MIKTVRAAALTAVVVLASAAGLPTAITATQTTATAAPVTAAPMTLVADSTAPLATTTETDAAAPADFAPPQSQPQPRVLDDEARCLAAAVYFEARGESPAGQLAVAEVILNRVDSGRFAGTICGVVKQHGQFSFVHGGQYATPRAGAAWASAQAVAEAALDGDGPSTVGNATYFHAARVAPGWGLRRVAAIGNHVFYR